MKWCRSVKTWELVWATSESSQYWSQESLTEVSPILIPFCDGWHWKWISDWIALHTAWAEVSPFFLPLSINTGGSHSHFCTCIFKPVGQSTNRESFDGVTGYLVKSLNCWTCVNIVLPFRTWSGSDTDLKSCSWLTTLSPVMKKLHLFRTCHSFIWCACVGLTYTCCCGKRGLMNVANGT